MRAGLVFGLSLAVGAPFVFADGYKKFQEGDLEGAQAAFSEEAASDGLDYKSQFNLGVVEYKLGKYQEAKDRFDAAASNSEGKLKADSLFNRGNAEAQLGDYEGAASSYRDALSYDNDNDKIVENLTWAEKMAKEKPKDEQQKQKDSNSDQDQKKDKDSQESEQKQGEEKEQSDGKQQQSADDQQSADQQSADQQSAENQQGSEAEQKSVDQGGQNNQDQGSKMAESDDAKKEQKDQQITPKPKGEEPDKAEEDMAASKGSDKNNDPTDENKGAAMGDASQASAEELKAQDAQKVIRSVDDKIGKYMFRATKEQLEGRSNNGKDW